jgi:hypothetical protein
MCRRRPVFLAGRHEETRHEFAQGVAQADPQLAMRHLDGDRPLQLVIVPQVNDAEAAFAQRATRKASGM